MKARPVGEAGLASSGLSGLDGGNLDADGGADGGVVERAPVWLPRA